MVTTNKPEILVGEIVGSGAEARQEIKVKDWTLTRVGQQEEPLVEDLVVARRLGYKKPEDIRRLIKRMVTAGQLYGEVFSTVEKTSGTKGGRPSVTYYLTKKQGLKVTTHSETENADKVVDELIEVYLAVEEGRQQAPQVPANDNDTLLAFLREQREQDRALIERLFDKVTQAPQFAAPPSAEVIDFPSLPSSEPRTYTRPAPSGKAPLQTELFRHPKEFKWYSILALQNQWGIGNDRFWSEFRQAGGNNKVHVRSASPKGYQVRGDIVDKILVQLNHQQR